MPSNYKIPPARLLARRRFRGGRTCAPAKNLRLFARPIATASLCFILLLAIAPDTARAEVIDKIVAIVGGTVITEVDLSRAIAAKDRSNQARKSDPALRQEVLGELIDDALFNQLLSKAKIEVSEDDLARAIANILHQNRMSPEQLKAEVASKGMSYDEYKKKIELEIRRVKFVNQTIGPQVKISDQDLRDYYQRSQERFRGGKSAHISEIVLPIEGITSQEEFDKLGETALAIVAKSRKGQSFDSLARQYSKGPGAAVGGDMGMVDLKELPQQVGDAVRGMKIGEVSNPIVTQNAIIIVKLVSLPEIGPGDFERMRENIYNALYEERIKETLATYLQKERQKAFIEIR